MTTSQDPEHNETRALFELADFSGRQVLEIGSGNGRLTWRFADRAAHVTAVEPWTPGVEQAEQQLPAELKGRVEFLNFGFEDFADATPDSSFDLVLLSWSLC